MLYVIFITDVEQRVQLLEPTNEDPHRSVVWSHPAFANRSVYARNDRELVFRGQALASATLAFEGHAGALSAAERLTAAAKDFRASLAEELAADFEPFLDERGRPGARARRCPRPP